MTPADNKTPETAWGSRFRGFHALMPKRIEHILVVSSLYESFILEEEGLLTEMITSQYLDMGLSHAPHVSRASTGKEALGFIEHNTVDLVLTMTRLGGMKVEEFARRAKEIRPTIPIVVLADEARELYRRPELRTCEHINRVYLWYGDAKILLAIIKVLEDRFNAEHDTAAGDVRVIILVENSVRFYSTYLPLIYTELMKLTQSLMVEGVNLEHRLLRQRARPKILLADNFEEAWELYSRYSDNVLGVISDIGFPKGGQLDQSAGLELARRIREHSPHLPILLQSSDAAKEEAADQLRVCFINKKSPSLLRQLRDFMLSNLGFGDFVFQLPDGTEVGRAHDLRSLEEVVAIVPDESLAFHAQHNHFSNWLMARTEFELASVLRKRDVSEFSSIEAVRRYLLSSLAESRVRSKSGVITDFSPDKFDITATFSRIGTGSIGGKARGLAFINTLLRHYNVRQRFKEVRIGVPHSVAIGTDVFDRFLDENDLSGLVTREVDDRQIIDAFLHARLPEAVRRHLAAFIEYVQYPLAVRSSSMLEDSQDRPFAGIYSTHMIPNNHYDPSVRFEQLCRAVKLVFASTLFRVARRYLEATGRHSEEERMGVIIQEVIGSPHGNRFYPTFSGIARSYNFYPTGQMEPEDGIASVALGLGKMVVEGGETLRFSPAYPQVLPQFASTKEMLDNSQRHFYALDLSLHRRRPSTDPDAYLTRLDLEAAAQDGTLDPIGSVYSPENDAVYDGLYRDGLKLVTFAHVLKSGLFPLAEILQWLLQVGREGMACPVEIEFAVDMNVDPMRFGFLQIRPIISHEEFADVHISEEEEKGAFCYSSQALGNGRIRDIQDIVYVKPKDFDSAQTREMALEVARINDKLRKADRRYMLIGPGRWGTADRWLGIPVTWEQISSAQVIVEATLEDFIVTPSQGTHFFQNLTSLGVGYLTVDTNVNSGRIDWNWLDHQPAAEESKHIRHVALSKPLGIKLDGRSRRGVILPPGALACDEDLLEDPRTMTHGSWHSE
jgi:CheY-like chemotaxis protein